MRTGLVGLSSAAIVSVYAVGFIRTSTDESRSLVAASETSTVAPTQIAPATSTRSTGSSSSGSLPTTVPRSVATPTPSTASGSAVVVYADGTYTGVGTSRHGSIEATVVVKTGRIVSAEISGCQTKYPCSKVASLPDQVVSHQSGSVSYVSGATDSSKAYAGAVAAALAKARV